MGRRCLSKWRSRFISILEVPSALLHERERDVGLRLNLANPWRQSTEGSLNASKEGEALCE
jgi:hypothetical protein